MNRKEHPKREDIPMGYTLEQFCTESREVMKQQPGDAGREVVRQKLEKLLTDKDFFAEHCGPEKPPHNHGSSWAIYGQAAGETDVVVWRRKAHDANTGHAELEVEQEYKLRPGKAGLFNPGVVHSVDFTDGSRYIRVTGTDLNKLDQDVYDLDKQTVFHGNPAQVVDAGSNKREAEMVGAKS
jgi:hypothetical protein